MSSKFCYLLIGWIELKLTSFFKSSARLLRLARKPGRKELWLSIKICFLGMAIIGAIGFIIKLLANFLLTSFI
jgi:protein translocase SEC61 complex gamma subunit